MKVIACDFDNTFYVKDEKIFKENIKTVDEFIKAGNIFIIITGRSNTNIYKVIQEHNIKYSYLVCQDGANIFDTNNNCIKTNLLDNNKSEKIEEYLIKNNIEYHYESAYNDEDNIKKANKITVCLKETDDKIKLLEEIKRLTDIYAYISSRHINIIDSYVNKSTAIDYLIKSNIINENITVIGDDINDYEMLSKYHGVIMKKHDLILDTLKKEEIISVNEYIKELNMF